MTPEQRDELLQALNRLGDPEDAAALAAARQAAELVGTAETSWDDLIRAPLDDDEPGEEAEDEAPATAPELNEQAASSAENKEASALIEKLLARDLYEGTREELLAYQEDIAAGEFQADDLQYLRALDSRLQSKKK